MDREEEATAGGGGEEIAERTGDLRSLALLKVATEARPGLIQTPTTWIAAADEASRWPTSPATCTCGSRSAAPAPTPTSAPATSTASRAMLDEMLELSGGDPTVGAGIVIGNPVAWALMGKATVRRERGEFEEAEELLELGARAVADEPTTRRRRAGSAARRRCCAATRGDTRGGRWRSPAATAS